MARPVRLGITFDTRPVLAGLKGLERQVPFATALILTRLAQSGQRELKSQLPAEFTLRTKRVLSGIKIQRATKQKLLAKVGTVDDYMAQQVTGGPKKGYLSPDAEADTVVMGGRFVAVPVVGSRARKTFKARVTPANLPNAFLANPKNRAFVARLGKSSAFGIFRRIGKKRHPIERLYNLVRAAKYEKRWQLQQNVDRAMKRDFAETCRVELGKILADAERRAAAKAAKAAPTSD